MPVKMTRFEAEREIKRKELKELKKMKQKEMKAELKE